MGPTRSRPARLVPWLLGVAVGVVVVGPGLGPGSLLNLDLVLLPELPVPAGVWGLGPELPRRVPFLVPLGWASAVGASAVAGKALLVGAVAAAFTGAWRLVDDAPRPVPAIAGLTYAVGPLLLTRIGVGHLALVVAMAVLPWALPTLLRPADDLRRTFLWVAALGVAGYVGALVAGLAVFAGLACDRWRRTALVAAVFAVASLPWLVPGLIVGGTGPSPADAAVFETSAEGPDGVLSLLAGRGFWIESEDAGRGGWAAAVVGVVLAGLAVAGWRDLPDRWRRPAAVAAALGLALTAASAVPGIDDVLSELTGTFLGAPLRETQRCLALYVVSLAPAAALGAARFGRSAGVVPAVLVVLLVAPSLWGLDGRAEPVDLPDDWHAARDAVRAAPGTVLALPWHMYLDVSFAGGRRVLNPLPLHLGGDVLSSSDPELAQIAFESADPREGPTLRLLADLLDGRAIADELADRGVRWVVLLREVDWRAYAAGVRADPGLERELAGDTLELYRVRGWRGPVVTRDGTPDELRSVVAPLQVGAPDEPATWFRAGGAGWLQGVRAAGTTRFGALSLPGGSPVVWYWPALLVIAGDLVTVAAVLVAVRGDRPWTTSRSAVSSGRRPSSGQLGSTGDAG